LRIFWLELLEPLLDRIDTLQKLIPLHALNG
jgi:hypothetical protein